ncbi:unnamed protein product [Penicillium olsonii]|nr:unnamed protein product [Penicillium olsonii]
MPPKEKYTDPELRDEVKEEIHQSDKGGQPGQWSARKAQLMASEYKKRGGDYNTTKEEGQSESQKNLDKWTKEEWQTKEGEGTARQEDDSRKRYLPKKAWEEMSEGDKEETDEKKVEGSKEGEQFVGNTEKAKDARKKASNGSEDRSKETNDDGDDGNEKQTGKESQTEKTNGSDKQKDSKHDNDNSDKGKDDEDNSPQDSGDEEDESKAQGKTSPKHDNGDKDAEGSKKSEGKGAGDKRTAKQNTSPNKKQKDTARMRSLRKRD